ncbi:MAG: hypothetical protein LQ352_007313 [Teloschistes flavicans]|nr:MAG: hypothetical protein LQ352_007313 [Teloschistes flavicans]
MPRRGREEMEGAEVAMTHEEQMAAQLLAMHYAEQEERIAAQLRREKTRRSYAIMALVVLVLLNLARAHFPALQVSLDLAGAGAKVKGFHAQLEHRWSSTTTAATTRAQGMGGLAGGYLWPAAKSARPSPASARAPAAPDNRLPLEISTMDQETLDQYLRLVEEHAAIQSAVAAAERKLLQQEATSYHANLRAARPKESARPLAWDYRSLDHETVTPSDGHSDGSGDSFVQTHHGRPAQPSRAQDLRSLLSSLPDDMDPAIHDILSQLNEGIVNADDGTFFEQALQFFCLLVGGIATFILAVAVMAWFCGREGRARDRVVKEREMEAERERERRNGGAWGGAAPAAPTVNYGTTSGLFAALRDLRVAITRQVIWLGSRCAVFYLLVRVGLFFTKEEYERDNFIDTRISGLLGFLAGWAFAIVVVVVAFGVYTARNSVAGVGHDDGVQKGHLEGLGQPVWDNGYGNLQTASTLPIGRRSAGVPLDPAPQDQPTFCQWYSSVVGEEQPADDPRRIPDAHAFRQQVSMPSARALRHQQSAREYDYKGGLWGPYTSLDPRMTLRDVAQLGRLSRFDNGGSSTPPMKRFS